MIDPIVDTAWARLHRDEVVLADVRWYPDGSSTRAGYDAGHLPGAVYLDLNAQLAGPPTAADGRHPLPDPTVFAAAMSAAGIGDGTTVVAYDDAGGVIAARLVWMLRALGEPAALLDGGLAGGVDGFGELSTRAQELAPSAFTPRPWPAHRLATLAEAAAGAAVLIDARDGQRFRGETEPMDPRAGHIPGARNLVCRDNTLEGRLLPTDLLRARFESAGVHPGTDFISYCGSGVTACHNLLVAEHIGCGVGRLYPGSWSQYSADPHRPAAVGAE